MAVPRAVEACSCGHDRWTHRKSGCDALVPSATGERKGWVDGAYGRVQRCRCPRYDNSVLPDSDGERLTFGYHRQRAQDAETAPAWPRLKEDES